MNHLIAALLIMCSVGIGILAIVLIIGLFADVAAKRGLRNKIERLRDTGAIARTGVDADSEIIRLANEGKREEAALLYVSAHGGRLANARKIVGSGIEPKRLLLVISVLFLCFVLIALGTYEQKIPLATIWLANFVLFTAFWMRASCLITRNRKRLAAGQMPSSNDCAWAGPANAAHR